MSSASMIFCRSIFRCSRYLHVEWKKVILTTYCWKAVCFMIHMQAQTWITRNHNKIVSSPTWLQFLGFCWYEHRNLEDKSKSVSVQGALTKHTVLWKTMKHSILPRICWSCSIVVENESNIWRHSSCSAWADFLSTLGIAGTSPSDHVGNALAAATTAPSTKSVSTEGNAAKRKYKQGGQNQCYGLHRHITTSKEILCSDSYNCGTAHHASQRYWRPIRRNPCESLQGLRNLWAPKDSAELVSHTQAI
jgi:hypothetical protein